MYYTDVLVMDSVWSKRTYTWFTRILQVKRGLIFEADCHRWNPNSRSYWTFQRSRTFGSVKNVCGDGYFPINMPCVLQNASYGRYLDKVPQLLSEFLVNEHGELRHDREI